MGYLGRRIGKSQDTANPTADGTGGGILDLFANGYFERQDKIYNAPAITPGGIEASGGVINEYVSGPKVYRAHIFTATSSFDVTSIGTLGGTVEYLVVGGGGGGGGGWYGGGGGAGGLRTNLPGIQDAGGNPLSISASYPVVAGTNYPVTVGAGGAGSHHTQIKGSDGGDSQFGPPSSGAFVYGTGGGGGGSRHTPTNPGRAGGSGGGASQYGDSNASGGATPASPDGLSPTDQGHAGAGAPTSSYGSSGGGAGAPGNEGGTTGAQYGSTGGAGVQVAIAGPTVTTFTGVGAKNPANNQYQYFAGGGGGGTGSNETYAGGLGGGGRGAVNSTPGIAGDDGTMTSGGGGGGGTANPGNTGYYNNIKQIGRNGGSGIVVVRYEIAEVSAVAKATGGAISFYNGKTIHTFNNSGTFTAPSPLNPTPLTAECFVVGGGGGGGAGIGGGGGAGGVVYKPGIPITLDSAYTISLGAGGIGQRQPNAPNIFTGTQSTALGLTAKGGGGGGNGQGGTQTGAQGGSSGGTGSSTGSNPGSAIQPSTSNPGATVNAGHVGGPGASTTNKGGGGGGAGGAATGEPMPSTGTAGIGGLGLQIPATFQNPEASYGATGPGSGTAARWWFAGGGGGGAYNPAPATGGPGGGPGGPYAGAGAGGTTDTYTPALNALASTGSGGGGGGYHPGGGRGGSGGSGIVLIAYPT